MKNNLYTLGYFKKRLKDSNIKCFDIVKKYSDIDKRYWTIMINDEKKIFCTCLKYGNDCEFSFYDSCQRIKNGEYIVNTSSMEVIIAYILSVTGK